MHAYLLPIVIAMLAVFPWWRRRYGSTQTEVTGDLVTPRQDHGDLVERLDTIQRAQADIYRELDAIRSHLIDHVTALRDIKQGQLGLRDIGTDIAKEIETTGKVLDVVVAAETRRAMQLATDSVCSTGGHYIRRIR